jgi:O-6-methylguanine DNA methyltransferase
MSAASKIKRSELLIGTSDGVFLARYSEKGLSGLNFPSTRRGKAALLNGVVTPQILRWHRSTVAALKRALAGRAPGVLPPVDISAGTAFQQRVWRALRKIGCGQTRSYREVAQLIGKPKAVRAVGGACGANPIPVLVPCHRVLAANRKLGGFSGGLNWKRALLAREGVVADSDGCSMKDTTLLTQIARKTSSGEAMADRVSQQPELLPEILKGLDSAEPAVKYGCSKVVRLVSERNPEVVYPMLDLFVGLLDCDNNFLKWGAILVIGNLAAVDSGKRIDRILDRYLQPIRGDVMITAANVIGSAAKIALARPELADKIARQILKVEKAEYQTAECRNVAMGHAIKSLDQFFDDVRRQQPVLKFVRRQLRNRRPAVRKKAADFLKRHADGHSAR